MSTKKCTGIVIKKMDPKIIGVIVGMLLCLSSSVSSAMSTGGNGDDSESPTGPTGPTPPKAEYIVADESHLSEYKGGTVEMGAGTSVDECRTLAYEADYPAFGFRKATNTCWAIVDGEATAGKVTPLADHVVGCVTAGEDINTGCKTTKTNVIRARHYKGYTSFNNIDCTSIPTCRTAATAEGANHFGWRETAGNGWVVTAPDISSTTPEFLVNHTIGCTDVNKKPPNC